MYETHFGLNKRPFRALAAGTDVFVGPQTAATMAGLKKALAGSDSIVTVSGPVGVGKTTLVRRALEAVGNKQTIISVGRMQLGHDEVLELLLEEMGSKLPASTVQRFSTFRRLLKQRADEGTRVFIVVEDASRVGADALSELEALTAADAGVSEGANIVLMGGEDMSEVLQSPRLDRLKQRLRLRQKVSPLSNSELLGYFKHCFRLAGKEFDTLFEQGSDEVVHALSNGIPRMANNIVDAALSAAADGKQDRVGIALIKQVATDEFGIQTGDEPAAAKASPADVVVEQAPAAPVVATEEAPVEEPAQDDDAVDAISELIQDTLPDLAIMAPALVKPPVADVSEERDEALQAAQVEPVGDEIPEWERDPTLAQLQPDLDALDHAMAVAQGLEPDVDADSQNEKPEQPPERVPEITLDREIQAKIDEAVELLEQAEEEAKQKAEAEASAEANKPVSEILAQVKIKKPDTASIEAQFDAAEALAVPVTPAAPAVEAPPKAPPVAQAAPVAEEPSIPVLIPPPAPVAKAPPVAPAVEAPPQAPAAEVAAQAAPKASPVAPTAPATKKPAAQKAAEPAVQASQEEDKKADPELEKIAADLARAKTIDDCDDKMAETLFGEEFSLMAAQVAANASAEQSANDDHENLPGSDAALPVADFDSADALNVEIATEANGTGTKLDASASQRLATVRALNSAPKVRPPASTPTAATNNEPPPAVDQPESIEDQINTSMTQTLAALNVRPPPVVDDDDDDDDTKSGFFSRFRRN